MLKTTLVVSITLNMVLGLLAYNSQSSVKISKKEIERIRGIYKKDVGILELLLKNKISKVETLNTFKQNLDDSDFFDKPSESGIGAGYLFFEFKDDGRLEKVKQYDFAEKYL